MLSLVCLPGVYVCQLWDSWLPLILLLLQCIGIYIFTAMNIQCSSLPSLYELLSGSMLNTLLSIFCCDTKMLMKWRHFSPRVLSHRGTCGWLTWLHHLSMLSALSIRCLCATHFLRAPSLVPLFTKYHSQIKDVGVHRDDMAKHGLGMYVRSTFVSCLRSGHVWELWIAYTHMQLACSALQLAFSIVSGCIM